MFVRVAAMAMAAAFAAAPAHAAGVMDIPEPGNASLFALGVVGLIVGRYAARRKPPG